MCVSQGKQSSVEAEERSEVESSIPASKAKPTKPPEPTTVQGDGGQEGGGAGKRKRCGAHLTRILGTIFVNARAAHANCVASGICNRDVPGNRERNFLVLCERTSFVHTFLMRLELLCEDERLECMIVRSATVQKKYVSVVLLLYLLVTPVAFMNMLHSCTVCICVGNAVGIAKISTTPGT